MNVGALLARSELLAALGPDALDQLARASTQRDLARGEVLFDQEDPGSELFMVCSGRIAMAKRSADGRSSVVALMEEEDLFGEMSLFDGKGRSTEARALEPSVVVAVPYPAVKSALAARPEALWTVVSLLVQRLRVTDEALADSMFLDVTGRTAKRILELAGSSDSFVLPVTQEELAGMVGASRERVNKAIATFCRLHWLELNDRRYRILDRAKLAQRAV
ncbi:MAG TPA: Crp/Fnr family transcriptional regulator [Acidimicrobiales bacterium]|nr:Crp/Fnr family transcriptional regulator [Acidimicrobiales bacterium]